jgi:NADPH:quinone reductase-like Zn-dependent oxidoreductase
MRAVVYDRYGPPDVLRLEEVEQPVPKEDEVLVRIHATTVNRTDCGFRSAEYFISRFVTGLLRPKRKILGMELAGEVEAVGRAVTKFEVGDQVFGVTGSGAHAEFVCMRESAALAHKPAGMTFEEATAVCDGASLALACLGKAELRTDRSIVVYGASGSVGTAAVQLAKHFGAHVTAVCNTKNVELVRSLGADEVIDYLQSVSTLAEAGRHLPRDRSGVHVARPDPGPGHPMDRRQEGGVRDRQVQAGRRPLAQGADRGRGVSRGDRSVVPLGGCDRGDQVCRNAPEDRERRPDSRLIS